MVLGHVVLWWVVSKGSFLPIHIYPSFLQEVESVPLSLKSGLALVTHVTKRMA